MSDSNVSLVITQNRKLNIEFMQPPPPSTLLFHILQRKQLTYIFPYSELSGASVASTSQVRTLAMLLLIVKN
jgi:hypothetical protein